MRRAHKFGLSTRKLGAEVASAVSRHDGNPNRLAGNGQQPGGKLDQAFTDACFWVVSRGNNCHYCLGHQEIKLRMDGLNDDTIAALDCDWSGFEPRMQAALGYTAQAHDRAAARRRRRHCQSPESLFRSRNH